MPTSPTLRGCTQLTLAQNRLHCILKKGWGKERQPHYLGFLFSRRQVDCACNNQQLSDLYLLIKSRTATQNEMKNQDLSKKNSGSRGKNRDHGRITTKRDPQRRLSMVSFVQSAKRNLLNCQTSSCVFFSCLLCLCVCVCMCVLFCLFPQTSL